MDVLPLYAVEPPYTALTLYFPCPSVDVLNIAVPLEFRVPVPRVVLPLSKLTVPVGVPPFGEITVTVAVNVTVCPTLDGLGAEPIVIAVVPLLTTWVNAADVLLAYCVSPVYAAVIKSDPAGRLVVINVACPELTVPVPRTVWPCLNVTAPVAAEGVMVAVKVTACPTKDGFSDDARVVVVAVLETTLWVIAAETLALLFASPL